MCKLVLFILISDKLSPMSYVFIDESGVGKRVGRSAVAIVYLTIENIDIFDKSVVNIEQKIRIEAFHWAHTTWQVRRKFIEVVCLQNFFVKIALLKNPFKESTSYEYALKHLLIEKDISSVIIDGKKSKSYERRIKKVLRDKGISVKKLRTANDQSYPALRVADAIAGIARFRYENPNDSRIQFLYELILKKIHITLEE